MYLRKLEMKDAPLMLQWMHDRNVTENLRTDFASKTLQDAENFIRKCFRLLGSRIRSIHLKDVKMGDDLPCCIREVMVGQGALPLHIALEEAEKLGENTTVFTEHYDTHEDYVQATAYVRQLTKTYNINIK